MKVGRGMRLKRRGEEGACTGYNTTVELIYTHDKTSDQIPIFFMSIGF